MALVVLGLVGFLLIQSAGTNEAIREAKQLTQLAGHGIVEPALTPGLLEEDHAALARLDAIVRTRVLLDPVVRVKLWTATGRIVYSDARALIGSVYPLGDDERRDLRTGAATSQVSDLTEAENHLERGYGKLLEVYLPIVGPGGTRLLFETYQRFGAISASSRRLLLAFAPAVAGILVLLWLVQLPLAARLARRLRESLSERQALLQRAIQSSELERRRVARDLHDGAVQNLSGIAWSLSAAAAEAPAPLAGSLDGYATETRRTIKELRSLLVEIYPPDLHRTGLEAALGDLTAALESRRITASLDLPVGMSLSQDCEQLIFRVAQEALRNTTAHAHATTANVRLRLDNHTAALSVSDDGCGFDPAHVASGSHFGLRMLRDVVGSADGTLEVVSAPGAGTTVRAVLPLS